MMDRKPMNKQDTQHNEEQDSEKVLADGPSKKNLKKIIQLFQIQKLGIEKIPILKY